MFHLTIFKSEVDFKCSCVCICVSVSVSVCACALRVRVRCVCVCMCVCECGGIDLFTDVVAILILLPGHPKNFWRRKKKAICLIFLDGQCNLPFLWQRNKSLSRKRWLQHQWV